jgi:hydroxymethylglutaryl-CoA lyase
MKSHINIVEVGPRDGLQNEKLIVPTNIKLAFIEKLIACGLKTIEATSFVSPKWVPQLADHNDLVKHLPKSGHVRFPVLVPNDRGLTNAIQCGVKDIAVFAGATETFSEQNIHRTINQSLNDYRQIIIEANHHNIRVRGYVSCVLGCPFEGKVPLSQVVTVANALYEAGCDEISLGDTIGVGTPLAARNMIKALTQSIPVAKLAVHFHDTYGQALANILACLEEGVLTIDSSVAGLGGCPYAKGATGNVATEDVVYMLQGMGLETGIHLTKLIETGVYICEHLKHSTRSKVAIAMLAKQS